jgi:formate dehydrogenase subunit gamma
MAGEQTLAGHRVLRYTLTERMVHWAAGFSYIYLLMTGLAFWTPWMFWMAVVLGGGSVSRMLHPWAGLIYTWSVWRMYVLWNQDMRITEGDRKWMQVVGAYARHEHDKLPPVDRFNAGQKYLFWLMFWGGFALLLSGVVLWFPEYIPGSLGFLRSLAIIVHPVAALLTIGGFIIHVYMGTAVVRGGFSSVIRGEVSENWARVHHPLWLARISGNAPAKK